MNEHVEGLRTVALECLRRRRLPRGHRENVEILLAAERKAATPLDRLHYAQAAVDMAAWTGEP